MRSFQRVVLATVQIQPFARAQLAIQLRNPEDDMPLETMQHNVTCDLMRRDFRVGRDDQADSLEMPRFDEGHGLRVCELAAERALVENLTAAPLPGVVDGSGYVGPDPPTAPLVEQAAGKATWRGRSIDIGSSSAMAPSE